MDAEQIFLNLLQDELQLPSLPSLPSLQLSPSLSSSPSSFLASASHSPSSAPSSRASSSSTFSLWSASSIILQHLLIHFLRYNFSSLILLIVLHILITSPSHERIVLTRDLYEYLLRYFPMEKLLEISDILHHYSPDYQTFTTTILYHFATHRPRFYNGTLNLSILKFEGLIFPLLRSGTETENLIKEAKVRQNNAYFLNSTPPNHVIELNLNLLFYWYRQLLTSPTETSYRFTDLCADIWIIMKNTHFRYFQQKGVEIKPFHSFLDKLMFRQKNIHDLFRMKLPTLDARNLIRQFEIDGYAFISQRSEENRIGIQTSHYLSLTEITLGGIKFTFPVWLEIQHTDIVIEDKNEHFIYELERISRGSQFDQLLTEIPGTEINQNFTRFSAANILDVFKQIEINQLLPLPSDENPLLQQIVNCFFPQSDLIPDIDGSIQSYLSLPSRFTNELTTSSLLQSDIVQCYIGYCYCHGIRVNIDLTEAIRWYTLAANQGNALGQCFLGTCYFDGEGVDQNYQLAINYYELAAQQGHALAQRNLGICYEEGLHYPKNYRKAVEYYTLSANQGNSSGQYNLGACYQNRIGVEVNLTLAFEFYQKSALQGNPLGQCSLGQCFYYGQGVQQNKFEAFKWFHNSSKQGNPDAQYFLGKCYYDGEGTEPNLDEAIKWFQKSADNGNRMAQYQLGTCYEEGREPLQQDITKAKYYYSLSSTQGFTQARTALARLNR